MLNDMMIARNFGRSEFQCKCSYNCGRMVVDITLITIAQLLRNKFGVGVVRSGNRCLQHNIDEDGLPNSFHTLGMAVDLNYKHGNVHEWAREIEALGFGEWVQVVKYADDYYGEEQGFIHIEIDYD